MMSQAVEAPALRVVGTGVLENGHAFYLVPSGSDPARYYAVEQWPTHLECQCKDAFYRRHTCKHMRAAMAHKAKLELARANAEAMIAEAGLSRGTTRQSSHPGDTALMRRSNRPFSLMK